MMLYPFKVDYSYTVSFPELIQVLQFLFTVTVQ